MKRWLAVFLMIAAGAAARAPDGTLDIVVTPNSGMPAIVGREGAFNALLSRKASVKLVGPEREYPLEPEWSDPVGGRVWARCPIPTDLAPGCYAIEADAVASMADAPPDRNTRSVYVVEAFPETYTIVHITDVHIGSDRAGRPAEAIFSDMLDAINEIAADVPDPQKGGESIEMPAPAFILITGDLTHAGTPEEFRAFVEALDRCILPTFVCPGNHDRQGLNYEKTFGPLTYLFRFGEDGYLSFDTKDFVTADELGPQDADLEVYRRAMADCRWAIGFTHRYEPLMGMRSQLVLFVDNPLDLLVFGHWHRQNREDEKAVPWGTTPIIVTPAAIDGALRLIHVGPYRVYPEKAAYPVKVER